MASYIKYDTPGHGYLKVSIEEIQRLGIKNQISLYSFSKGGYVFLEEDADMSLFFKVKKKNSEDISYSVKEITEEEFYKLNGKIF